MKVKILHTSLAAGCHTVKFIQILAAVTSDKKEHKLRIDIESNSNYSAHIERFNGEEWKNLGYIPKVLMKTDGNLLHKSPTAANFEVDRLELLKLAKVILE